MENDRNEIDVREAVAIFHSVDALQSAIEELLSSGFDRAELSVLASESAGKAKLGPQAFTPTTLEDDPSAPRAAYVSPAAMGAAEGGVVGALAYVSGVATAGVVALAGGPLTMVVLGAVLAGGAGGLIGTGLAEAIGHRRAAYFQEQLDRGGLLLWVRTWDANREKRAVDILSRHTGEDVHIHGIGDFSSGRPEPTPNRSALS